MKSTAYETRKQSVKEFADTLEKLLRATQEPDKPGMPRLENPRATLAALRSGLGGARDRMWPHIAPFLDEREDAADRWLFVVGALAGWHPVPRQRGASRESLGQTARPLRDESDSMTAHFAALLACNEHDLPAHLQRIVGLLRGKDIAVDWRTLLNDLTLAGWNHPERRVQSRWARDFYRTPKDFDNAPPSPSVELSSDS